ncbi:hypothetical protein D3C86_1826670 [compost metagenome]
MAHAFFLQHFMQQLAMKPARRVQGERLAAQPVNGAGYIDAPASRLVRSFPAPQLMVGNYCADAGAGIDTWVNG